ncbi:hypothetical protein A5893_01195 [Pedobacter psychrophilus]|uniref:Uncharacterized protein n=1 Tax=Pedobacter psychrophilus TaxID=1826909 RepID=A0A179DLZ9_9SPHI|nr:hypothetical protein [Pedobacter psychrophilus]OAQ41760.1 hypothetical protein A5893_01195 [Pedobacter psychrophilus]
MKKTILQILFLLFVLPIFAKSANCIIDTAIVQTEMLPDKGYSLNQISKDNSLTFKETDSLKGATSYWVRMLIYNSDNNSKRYISTVDPNINTCLFTFNKISKKWLVNPSFCANLQTNV